MKIYSEFNDYEKDIVRNLAKNYPERYTLERAISAVEKYYEVMKEVGWLCSPEDWAKNLDLVISMGITPLEWKKGLDELLKY